MMKLIFYGLLIYILYKLIFDFVIPVSKATRQIKTKIREAQSQQHQQQPPAGPQQPVNRSTMPANDAEYIDYEEVK